MYLSSLEDHSSTPPMRSSRSDLDKSTSNSLERRYVVISIVIPLMNSPRRPALGGDVNHPNAGRINLQRMNGKKMKNLKKLWKMNLLRLSQVHRPSKYGKRRWHHHQRHHHKMCNHLGLHPWDRQMHLKNKGLFSSKVLSGGLKNLNPRWEVTSIVIHIYFLALHGLFFTLACWLSCIGITFRKENKNYIITL